MTASVQSTFRALADPSRRLMLMHLCERDMTIAEVADRFDRQRLSHFIVKYEGEAMEDTGRMVLGSLERSYAYLKSTLSFEPAEPIVVLLYARQDYAALGGPHWSAGFFDGKVRALTAQSATSAKILVAVPFAIVAIMHVMNPIYVATLFETEVGHVMLGAGLTMVSVGYLICRRIARVSV